MSSNFPATEPSSSDGKSRSERGRQASQCLTPPDTSGNVAFECIYNSGFPPVTDIRHCDTSLQHVFVLCRLQFGALYSCQAHLRGNIEFAGEQPVESRANR